MVAIKRAIEPYQRQQTKEKLKEIGKHFGRWKDNKKIGSADSLKPNETRDIVAKFVGVRERTLQKTERIVEAAEQNPELHQPYLANR